jgi:hypothetical protein
MSMAKALFSPPKNVCFPKLRNETLGSPNKIMKLSSLTILVLKKFSG